MSESIYNGNFMEFKKFIGPSLTNCVQYISRKHKKEKGKCEHCPETNQLEAAHKHGQERLILIKKILDKNYEKEKDSYKVPLLKFREKFIEKHRPIHNVILVLCKNCHVKYDKKKD